MKGVEGEGEIVMPFISKQANVAQRKKHVVRHDWKFRALREMAQH